jgi:hypothetical protein
MDKVKLNLLLPSLSIYLYRSLFIYYTPTRPILVYLLVLFSSSL